MEYQKYLKKNKIDEALTYNGPDGKKFEATFGSKIKKKIATHFLDMAMDMFTDIYVKRPSVELMNAKKDYQNFIYDLGVDIKNAGVLGGLSKIAPSLVKCSEFLDNIKKGSDKEV